MIYFYFALLGLDPKAEWSQERFEEAIQRKQVEWSNSSSGVGKNALKAKNYLDLLPDIQKTMSDPVLRQAHLHEFMERRRRDLKREITSYRAQGSTTCEELDNFIKEYQDVATKEEIITRLGIPIASTTTTPPHVVQNLDPSTLAAISNDLNILGKDTLYEWLGFPQTSGGEELCDAATRMHEEAVRAMLASPKMLAQKHLAGLARTIFSSAEKRRSYDETLRLRVLDGLLEELDKKMRRKSIPTLSNDMQNNFLQQARTANYSQKEASNRLKEYASYKHWVFPHPLGDTDKELQKQRSRDLLENLLGSKQYYSAQQQLNELKPNVLDQKEKSSYRQRIRTGTMKAEKELTSAKNWLVLSREDKIAHCRNALNYCADYREAQDLLSALLPLPRNLQISSTNPVVLMWDHPLQAVRYKIVRKEYAQPTTESDGQLLAISSDTSYQDSNPPIGIPLYYAIFTFDHEVTALTPATLRVPVFLTAEVTDVEVRFNNQLIDITWKNPPHLHNLIVMRKEKTAPTSIHDGTTIPHADFNHLTDHRVQNRIIYYYAIYCQFKDAEGFIRTTDGVIVEAMAESEMIRDLSTKHRSLPDGFHIEIRWSGSFNTGEVALLKTEDPPALREGAVIAAADLPQFGEILRSKQQPVPDFWPVSGVRYYTPLILFDGRAYIGTPHRHDCVEEVRNLTFQQLGNRVHLKWLWPPHCQEVDIASSLVNTSDVSLYNRGSTYRITREEYDHFGYAELKCAVNQSYAILVTTIVDQGGKQIRSSGTPLTIHVMDRVIVDYEIKKKFMQKGLFLIFRAEAEIFLPLFRVVCQRHRVPHHKEDGEVIFSAGEADTIYKELSIPLGELSCPPDSFARVFLEDEHTASRLQFRLPRREKLRLG